MNRYRISFFVLIFSLLSCTGCWNRPAELTSPPTVPPAATPTEPEEAALTTSEVTTDVAPPPQPPAPLPIPEPIQQAPTEIPLSSPIPPVPPATRAEPEPLPVPPPEVNTTLPVDTTSPVRQNSPVEQTSPVTQEKPIASSPLGFAPKFLRLLPVAVVSVAALLQDEASAETEEPGTEVSVAVPEPVVAEPVVERQGEATEEANALQGRQEQQAPETNFPGSTANAPKKLRFNFRYAPWKDVIEWFAEQAGLSLQADNVPSGSLNLTDSTYYTPNEALDVLNSYLLFKEYTILRKGNSMFVIFLPDGIPPNLLEPITPAELENRGKYEICRCVFNLDRTTPDVIQLEAEKLLGPQGSVVVLPKSQQIVITETAGTLRAIRDIIRRIDDPDELAGTIHIVEMRNLPADEALVIMRNLLGIAETDTSLRTSVDLSGTKIWMSGRGDMIERAKETIKTIDDSYASKDLRLQGEPQFDVYDVGTADPAAVLAVLQTLLAGSPDVRLSLDQKTGGLAALGRPANHATIRETIRQMQISTPQVEVIPLLRMSPLTAVESIKKFFETTTVSDATSTSSTAPKPPGALPPTVEADVSARQIVVRGTASQIKEIREYLAKLGESGVGGRIAGRETIRNIPLSPAAAALVLDQLKEIWPQIEQNEIKVVTPSAIVPSRATPTAEDVDSLIDETFEKEPEAGPVTQQFSTVRYQTVQQTTVTPVIAQLEEALAKLKTQSGDTIPGPPKKVAPVVVSHGPNGLMISSEDPEALNKLEELIQLLSDESVLGKTSLQVYRLKNSTAEVVAQTLQTLMGSGTTATLGVSGTGSVDTSAALAGENRAAVLGMLQFGSSIEKTGTVTITPDARLNALLIQANPIDHKTIEKLLPILDQADTGRDIAIRSVPRLIPLYNIRAEEAQTVVESAFADRLQSGGGTSSTSGSNRNSRTQNRSSSDRGQNRSQTVMPMMMPGMPPGGPGAMIQQMMSRMGGGNQNRAAQEQEAKMSLAVETRSNSLIVTSPESLFLVVEEFVRNLDEMAVQQETAYEIVTLKHVSPDIARQTLGNVLGDSVTFSTTRSATTTGGNRGGFGGNTFGGFGNNRGNTTLGGFGGGGANPFMNIMRGFSGGNTRTTGGQRAGNRGGR